MPEEVRMLLSMEPPVALLTTVDLSILGVA